MVALGDGEVSYLSEPSPDEFEQLFRSALSKGAMFVVFARCRVSYDGRAKSELGSGDRVIIVKPDGSFLIHQKERREPVNWQPPGSIPKVELEEVPVLVSVRRRPREILKVRLEKIYLAVLFRAEDPEELNLTGSEADMAELIFKNPSLIEEGFRPVAREKPVKHGIVDIFGFDREGNAVVLELKRRRADLHAVSQLKRYVEALSSEYSSVRGILVAPSLTSGAERFLKEEGLEFRRLKPPKGSREGVQRRLFD